MRAKRAGLYVRVSTEEQRTDLQERQLKEYVERRGWVLHKLYRDRMSGVSTKRPGLDEFLRDCRRRSIDVVVVWKFDRFARSLKTLISGLELCRSLGHRSRGHFGPSRRNVVPDDRRGGAVRAVADRRAGEGRNRQCPEKRHCFGPSCATGAKPCGCSEIEKTAISRAGTFQDVGEAIWSLGLDRSQIVPKRLWSSKSDFPG
jgi:Resolvase, N terminal domain